MSNFFPSLVVSTSEVFVLHFGMLVEFVVIREFHSLSSSSER